MLVHHPGKRHLPVIGPQALAAAGLEFRVRQNLRPKLPQNIPLVAGAVHVNLLKHLPPDGVLHQVVEAMVHTRTDMHQVALLHHALLVV